MADVPLCVPDANVALRWLFPNRELSFQAHDLMADYNGGRMNLLSPYHFPLEVGNGIRRRVIERWISFEEGQRHYIRFLAQRIPVTDEPGLNETAFAYTRRYSITLRDALYVTLAEFYQAPLITADENLLRALQRFPLAVFLGDYEPQPRR